MSNESKKIRVSKSPLTVYEQMGISTPFSTEQLLKLLQRTPKEHIYKRPAKGGGEWDYVTGTYVKKVLNYVFGFLWSTQVMRIEEKHGQVVVTVRLTVHKPDGTQLLSKEDIGKKDIVYKKGTQTPLDYGNDEKSAFTDGLKRCASQFGIASDVYGKEEFKEIETQIVEIKTPEEVAAEKEREKIRKHIEASKTAAELQQCEEFITDRETRDLYESKMVDFMAEDAKKESK